MREGKEAVAFVREQYEDALAEVDKLVKERQGWQEAWDEERQCAEGDKAALLVSIEASAAHVQVIKDTRLLGAYQHLGSFTGAPW